MKRTLPIASHPAAFASTLPPTSDNVMTIPSDISTFMTVLLFPGPREFTIYADDQTAFGSANVGECRGGGVDRFYPKRRAKSWLTAHSESVGINRHVVGAERALQ